MIPDWLISLAAGLFILVGIPSLLLTSAIGPFIFIKKILKRRFTILNVPIALLVSALLIILDYYLLYWTFAILQGMTFCALHNGCASPP